MYFDAGLILHCLYKGSYTVFTDIANEIGRCSIQPWMLWKPFALAFFFTSIFRYSLVSYEVQQEHHHRYLLGRWRYM